MQDLILYLAMALFGYLIARKLRAVMEQIPWAGKVQEIAIILLIVSMGMRMGANQDVIQNLGSIGLAALGSVALCLLFSVASVSILRRLIGLDRQGLPTGTRGELPAREKSDVRASRQDLPEEAAPADRQGSPNRMTVWILIAVLLGMVFGHFAALRIFPTYETFDRVASLLIKAGLCVLLIFVGLDLGFDDSVLPNIKKVGFKVFLIPFAVVLGTLAASLCFAWLSPLSVREALAVGSGFGWYSLAPGFIMDAGYIEASAISFMHNILRELLSIIFIPLVARRIGYTETVGMPGAAAMDVCLPVIERACNGNAAIYAFISGLTLSVLVPLLVPFTLGL